MNTVVVVLIFIVALVLSTGFLLLVFSLIPAINQLKSLLADLEKTSSEARELVEKLNDLGDDVKDKSEKVNQILHVSKDTVQTVSASLGFLNKKAFRQSAGWLAFLPAVKFGWDLMKKTARRK